jgi:hypothetical protein
VITAFLQLFHACKLRICNSLAFAIGTLIKVRYCKASICHEKYNRALVQPPMARLMQSTSGSIDL